MIQATNKHPPLKDQYLVVFILGKLIHLLFGEDVKFVPSNNTSVLDQYPYFTFTILNSNDPTSADWQEQFNFYLQIDCHHNDMYRGQAMAMELYRALRSPVYRRFFKQALVIPHDLSNAGDRTFKGNENYNRDYGFDCQFTVTGNIEWNENELNFKPSDYDINSVTTKGTAGEIKVSRNNTKEDK